jgi:restriction endonuclease S subunit
MKRLRFKDENGNEYPEWEIKKLGKLGKFFKGKHYSKSDISSDGNNLILYGDLFTIYNENILAVTNKTNVSIRKPVKGYKGDLLFPGSTTVDALSLVSPSALNEKALLGGDVICYRPDYTSNTYLAYYLNGKVKRRLAKKGQGTTIIHMYPKFIADFAIRISQSIEEQEKIGGFLSEIDKLVDKQKDKVDLLKEMKKGYLQKLFPKKGQKVPDLRFKGFTDTWEQRELNQLADVRDGTHDSPRYVNEGYPFITSKNVKDGYINYDDVQYITKTDFDNINKRSKVDTNDILMGMIGTIGNLALIREEPDFAIKNVALIKDVGKVDYKYLYHFLQSSNTMKQLQNGLDGGTQKFVSLYKVRTLKVWYPLQKEQKAIGSYFEKLDNLITLHQRKHETYEQMKKGYIQRLFAE